MALLCVIWALWCYNLLVGQPQWNNNAGKFCLCLCLYVCRQGWTIFKVDAVPLGSTHEGHFSRFSDSLVPLSTNCHNLPHRPLVLRISAFWPTIPPSLGRRPSWLVPYLLNSATWGVTVPFSELRNGAILKWRLRNFRNFGLLPPPCLHSGQIHSAKITQPSLLCLHSGNPLPPPSVDVIYSMVRWKCWKLCQWLHFKQDALQWCHHANFHPLDHSFSFMRNATCNIATLVDEWCRKIVFE